MIGITSINVFPMPMSRRLEMIKTAGFESVLMWWGPDELESREERVRLAKEVELRIENAHAATERLNSLWCPDSQGEQTLEELLEEIRDCAEYGVDTLVLHLTNGSEPPPVSLAGLFRVEKMIALADELKVRLAFENVRRPEHTRYILDHLSGDYVGLCYDSGHAHYWTADTDWLGLYNHQVFAIHLHDNFADKDAHLLPFDGSIDWQMITRQLAASSYMGAVTVESEMHASDRYLELGFDSFLRRAFERGKQLESMIQNEKERLR